MMDSQLPSSAVTVILSFFFLLFIILFCTRKGKGAEVRRNYSSCRQLLPPGPWKLPIIGSVHHMIGRLPHRALANLSKKYGPVMQVKIGEIDLVVISSPEAAKEITMTNDLNFASRPHSVIARLVAPSFASISLSPYGDYWRQLRKIANLHLLSPNQVKSYSSLREKEISNLIQFVSTSCSPMINLTQQLLTLSNNIALQAVCGSKNKLIMTALMKILKAASLFSIVEFYPSVKLLPVITGTRYRMVRMFRDLDAILDQIIEGHPQHKSTDDDDEQAKDFLDVLLKYTDEANNEQVPLTIDNIKSVIYDMLIAGTETSANIMEWAMAELMRNPAVMNKAQAEVRRSVLLRAGKEKKIEQYSDVVDGLDYLKMVIKETLRLHPPAPLLVPRVCAETCEVAGYKIVAGSRVVINAWAIGRDPKYWGDDAESFNPERFCENNYLDFRGTCFHYLPFGAGRRMCPGIGFGLATVELALAQLLFYFDWELPDGEKLDMTEGYGSTVYRRAELILLAKAHNNNNNNA